MSKKIFELANEIGKGALDIVEVLKANGFAVRNHMSSLADDELDKAMKVLMPSEAPAKKKVAKKKVAKKKATTAKKKVVKALAKSTEDDDAEGPKKTITRRKTVVRKKGSAKSSIETPEATLDETTNSEAMVAMTSDNAELLVEDKPFTFQEVKQAPSEEDKIKSGSAEVIVETEVEAKTEGKVEKPRFGLRVVKEATAEDKKASEEKKAERQTSSQKKFPGATTTTTTTAATSADTAKKRMGGLASLVANKKANINRSQTITEERADKELKSYAAQSGTGRPIYTQVKRKRIYSGPKQRTQLTDVKEAKRVAKLHGGATAEHLAKKLSIKLKDMIDKCLDINLLIKNGDYIGLNLAGDIAALYEYRVENVAFDEDKVMGKVTMSDEEKSNLPLRAPIITIMGHVDHGKTTLLDTIRDAKVASAEAGGITQHIGAYSVKVKDSNLTFLDTPGHAAFGAMRQRGADVTDIVVLIVAADDGVMPQTKESVKYIQNAGKPVIVAVNKMDREGANPDRIKQELAEFNITPEDWGGDTQFCPISALKGDGIDALLEAIALQAEILDLRAEPKGKAEGVVIESKIEGGRGPVATVLIQSGTLKKGDSIVVGETFGRARNLMDSTGTSVDEAGPSTPIQVLGLDKAPSPGDSLDIVKNEREAKKIVQNRIAERLKISSATVVKPKVSLEDFFATNADEQIDQKELKLVIRSDVQGSFEAIKTALESLSNPEVGVRVIGGGVGPISDSDVVLAESANGFLIGFNMRPLTSARKLADVKGVDVKTYAIIYELINDIKLAIEGLLDPEFTEEFIGRAEVRDTFSVPKIGLIAGSYVIDGAIKVGCNVRLLREGKIMFDGKMSSLKRFKDDAKEVKSGYECGVGLENYNDVKVGDLFEAYNMIETKRKLEDVIDSENIL